MPKTLNAFLNYFWIKSRILIQEKLMFKAFILLFIILINLNAMSKDVVYVEDINSSGLSLKDEFFNPNTKYYTLTIATLNAGDYDLIQFFKQHELTNALAYKYGKNKQYIKILSGLYKNGTQAQQNIKNLSYELQMNMPYSSKLFRHQKAFNPKKKAFVKSSYENNSKYMEKIDLKESLNSIYINDNEQSQKLKDEFFNASSNYYSISLGTIWLDKDKDVIKKFLKTHNIEKNTLVHLYGKNKDKARIIYGLFKSSKEARQAIKNLNLQLRKNKPFSMHMSKFQSFYNKNFPQNSNGVVQLKINDSRPAEKEIKNLDLSDEIKIVERSKIKTDFDLEKSFKNDLPKTKLVKKIQKPKVEEKSQEKQVNNVKAKVKTEKPKKSAKVVKKSKINQKNKFLKQLEYEDVYFVESSGNFNILSEVFLNEDSSFYTIDLGELNLSQRKIEGFLRQNNIKDDALAYKYGQRNEYAKVIYGAFETKDEAQKSIKKLNSTKNLKDLKISNIKEHHNIYKSYHKNLKRNNIVNNDYEEEKLIFYVEDDFSKNKLVEKFLQTNAKAYTINLTTFLEEQMSLEEFFINNNISNDAVAFKIGSLNSYYRIIYGLYDTFQDANLAIENLNYKLKRNKPFVTSIKANQNKFESYEKRSIIAQQNNVVKIELK